MAIKHIKEYYQQICDQYMQMLAEIKDFEEEARLLKDLIKNNNIDLVAFEDIQLQDNIGNNVATFKTLAEVMGVIIELLTELNIPYASVLAGEWRKRLSIGTGGNTRKAQKQKAQNYIQKKYALTVSEDEADALCIGTYRIMDDEKKNAFDWT